MSDQATDSFVSVEEEKEEVLLISTSGDTLPTGIPLRMESEMIEQPMLAPPERLPIRTKSFPEKIQKTYDLRLTEEISWPTDLPKYTPGENGVPLPKKYPVVSVKVFTPTFTVVETSGFQVFGAGNSAKHYLNMEQGLPSSFIHTVFEDSNGYFWIGSSDGLIRYDGSRFRQYSLDPIQDENAVYQIMEDQKGDLWIGHGPLGTISKFDGNEIVQIKIPTPQQRFNFWNNRLFQDRNGRIWIQTTYGLFYLEGDEFFCFGKEHGLVDDFILHVEERNDGVFWIITNSGLNIFDGKSFSGLAFDVDLIKNQGDFFSKSSFANDNFENVWFYLDQGICSFSGTKLSFYDSELFDKSKPGFFISGDGNDIWGANSENELLQIDCENLTVSTFSYELPNYLILPSLTDSHGRIWSVSEGNGIHRYVPNTSQHFTFDGILERSNASAIHQDRNGDYWIGSHGNGLLKFDGEQFISFPDLDELVIRSIKEDLDGNIWLAAQTGGAIKITETEILRYSKSQGIIGDFLSMHLDQNGVAWFGTANHGVVTIKGDQYSTFSLAEAEFLKSGNAIRAFLSDSKGNLWIGTFGGLRKFDGEFTTIYSTKESLCGNRVTSLIEDRNGNIWIGSQDGGVSVFDGTDFQSFSEENGLSSNEIWTLTEDAIGRIWVGADDCLNVFINQSSINASLTLSVPAVYCNIDGMMGGEFFANATILDNEANLWWGSNKGLSNVDPDYLIQIEPPRVDLSYIEVAQTFFDFRKLNGRKENGENWWVGEEQRLDLTTIDFDSVSRFNNYPVNLKLPYALNTIHFYFSGTQYPNPEELRYSYFIEGLDQNWSYPRKEANAVYRNISPGNYTLKVKVAGNENVWSEVFEYSFSVSPPWWQTTWAYLLWIGIIVGVIYLFYKSNLKRQVEKQETRRLKELENLKTRLYTNITHEFRTPLTVIMGITEQLFEKSADTGLSKLKKKDFAKGFGLIQRNSQNLLRLINQLLDLAKLDAGRLKINYAQGDVVSYLQYLTESFYSMATDKEIRLTFYTEVESVLMDYDEEKLQHIVYNLLSNAIKFTEEKGKIVLHVRKESKKDSEFLLIKVKDTGIGIAPEKLDHIFDRFFQVDGSATRRGEGTGIGLALTKELIDLMEGEVEINSVLNVGTEIAILLPITQNAMISETINEFKTPENHLKTAKNTAIVQTNESSDKPILLVVEDNPDVTIYIQTVLEKDYSVLTAPDGKKGIEMAIEHIPDVIISDVMMPEKNGFEVCETLKMDSRTSHVPIILLTAKSSQEDKVAGLKSGADAFLTKPFDRAELLVRLEKLVELRQGLKSKFSNYLEVPLSERSEKATDNLEAIFLQELSEVISQHIGDPDFGVSQLSTKMTLSQMQIYRKLKALTGKTPSQFIRSIRLQEGLSLLKSTDLTIAEIAYDTGFSDPNYFSRTFHKEFGMPPSDIRR